MQIPDAMRLDIQKLERDGVFRPEEMQHIIDELRARGARIGEHTYDVMHALRQRRIT